MKTTAPSPSPSEAHQVRVFIAEAEAILVERGELPAISDHLSTL